MIRVVATAKGSCWRRGGHRQGRVRVVGSNFRLKDEEEEAVVGRASTKLRKVAILG